MTAFEAALIGAKYLGYAVGIVAVCVVASFIGGFLRQSSRLRKQEDDEASADEVALSHELDAFVRSINEQGQKAA